MCSGEGSDADNSTNLKYQGPLGNCNRSTEHHMARQASFQAVITWCQINFNGFLGRSLQTPSLEKEEEGNCLLSSWCFVPSRIESSLVMVLPSFPIGTGVKWGRGGSFLQVFAYQVFNVVNKILWLVPIPLTAVGALPERRSAKGFYQAARRPPQPSPPPRPHAHRPGARRLWLTRGCAVQDAQVVSPGAAVVGCGAVVPHHHYLLGALETPDRAHMALASVLLPPLPVRAAHYSGPDPFYHHPVIPGVTHRGPSGGLRRCRCRRCCRGAR